MKKDINVAISLMLSAANLNDSYAIAMYGKLVYNYQAKSSYPKALEFLGNCMVKHQEPYCTHIATYYIEEAAQASTMVVHTAGGQAVQMEPLSAEAVAQQIEKVARDVNLRLLPAEDNALQSVADFRSSCQ